MRHVLDLDQQAPDASSPETASAYQSFYNKIRSEHDAMNNAYAEARRLLPHDQPAGFRRTSHSWRRTRRL